MKLQEDLTLQFDQADAALWYKLIEKELKGKPYEETLIKHLSQEISTKPYYTKEDLTKEANTIHDFLLKAKPIVGWNSTVSIFTSDFDSAKNQLTLSLEKGAECIIIEHPFSINVLEELLKEIDGQFVKVFVNYKGDCSAIKSALKTGGTFNDAIGDALLSGEFTHIWDGENSDYLKVDGRYLQWAGADAEEELAYTLAWSLDYFLHEKSKGRSIYPDKCLVNFSASTAYFQEIAKLRAFRILWDMLLNQEDIKVALNSIAQPRIQVETARHQFGSKDPQTNILRSATQAMAAVSGLADGVSVIAYDATLNQVSEFSHRIASNIHYMLKYEAHLDKVNDPLGGSYYIETLTQNLVNAAWAKFVKIENEGGFTAICQSGQIQAELKSKLQQKRQQIELGKSIFIGENKYQQDAEAIASSIDFFPPTSSQNLALTFEKLSATTR